MRSLRLAFGVTCNCWLLLQSFITHNCYVLFTSLLCFFVNFGTPRPQPLPLSQAPVHKVTDLNNRSAVCNKVLFKTTISEDHQKYHFRGPWAELIYRIYIEEEMVFECLKDFFFWGVECHEERLFIHLLLLNSSKAELGGIGWRVLGIRTNMWPELNCFFKTKDSWMWKMMLNMLSIICHKTSYEGSGLVVLQPGKSLGLLGLILN